MWLNIINKPLSRQLDKRLLSVACRTMCEMARVFVRSVENEERMHITFRYHPDGQQPPTVRRVYNFDRLKAEGLARTMNHIATKINAVVMKRAKKKNKALGVDAVPAEVQIFLSEQNGNIPVSTSEPNASAWTNGRCMQIDNQLFHVCVNVPTIRKLSLRQPMMVGFPVYADINLEFADVSDCKWTWYRLSNGAALTSPEDTSSLSVDDVDNQESAATKKGKKSKQTTVIVGDSQFYIPTVEDVGCLLKVECVPIRGEVIGEMVTAESSAVIQDGPAVTCPFEKQHKFTELLTCGDRCVLSCVHIISLVQFS